PGGALGMPGGATGMPGGVGAFGGAPQPKSGLDDPDAKWIQVWVEVKNPAGKMQNPMGRVYSIDHRWGKNNLVVFSPMFSEFTGVYTDYKPYDTFFKDWDKEYNAEAKGKDKNIKRILDLARRALARGQMPSFHKAMELAEK